ncbi:MAG: hypothetical protein U9P80_04665, partial [Thermodesulfobacteriota bacterium]|nr:hypothetical protein [Thermodesulfobacteriota bacterium]
TQIQEEDTRAPDTKPDAPKTPARLKDAVKTIDDLNTEFNRMIFEKKDTDRKAAKIDLDLKKAQENNHRLDEQITLLRANNTEQGLLKKEIAFLDEQLQDADYYIKNLSVDLKEKTGLLKQEQEQRLLIDTRMKDFHTSMHDRARLDVKVGLLQKELTMSRSRIDELEGNLEDEINRHIPLETEICELKEALDNVYSSLSQVRLKAKREAYGL